MVIVLLLLLLLLFFKNGTYLQKWKKMKNINMYSEKSINSFKMKKDTLLENGKN